MRRLLCLVFLGTPMIHLYADMCFVPALSEINSFRLLLKTGPIQAHREFVVEKQEKHFPLDLLLAKRLPDFSRRFFRKLLQEGKVIVNGKVMRRFAKVGVGSTIKFDLLERDQVESSSRVTPEDMNLRVLYEDEHLIAVYKPAGVNVQPSENAKGTLINGFLHYMEQQGVTSITALNASRAIVHRLDKETTGVCLLAKTQDASTKLSRLYKSRTVEKEYLAITIGPDLGPRRDISEPLFRKSSGVMAVPITQEEEGQAQPARSIAETILYSKRFQMSLVAVKILTGRMHQIRVHLNHCGSPVYGDKVYKKEEKVSRPRPPVDRTMLHAYSLCFKHPFTGAEIEVLSPPANDFLSCVKVMIDSYEGSNLSESQIKILSDIKSGKSGETLRNLGYFNDG